MQQNPEKLLISVRINIACLTRCHNRCCSKPIEQLPTGLQYESNVALSLASTYTSGSANQSWCHDLCSERAAVLNWCSLVKFLSQLQGFFGHRRMAYYYPHAFMNSDFCKFE